ncbi:hypothetical protein LTR05_005669 [Lithohypha guttulata]|uniref:E3 ubiquitin-protein ligase listerin n=1 Tax=Lithohypha guttulata TaxID=1690604 RepID=A0AAN7SY45_9EURO|nr:hypothetical protein LTR05_005669 [Lithohypha guttulata]
MSRKVKAQASSARAATGFGGFGSFQTAASSISYITEQPDLSQIAEPGVVVALKNLSKKDSTTKTKALDDLLESLKDNADLAVLTAWSDLYPRASIDNSQLVRRNAHALQGLLTVNAGKKIAPLLPKIVPSWLAGTFDSDKSVAKAANDALDKSFPTDDKKAALWKVYKSAIYERVEDALLNQTALTLSDERTTSPDEAQAKYVRVVSTGMRLLSQLVSTGLDSHEILNEKKLWEFAYHDDPSLRSATYGLLLTLLSKNIQDLDWTILSTSLLYKGLNVNQTGSSRAYVQALCKLTESHSSVWTTDYTAKTTASKRLVQFLRQGAQSGPADTWSRIAHLLRIVPGTVCKNNLEDVNSLIEAYRTGVLVERVHVDAAWSSYTEVCSWLVESLQLPEERDAFLEQNLMPTVTAYVMKTSGDRWRISGRADKTASTALRIIADHSQVVLEKTWAAAIDATITKMRMSLPETSKDYRTSQDDVASQGKRLLSLSQKLDAAGVPKALISSLLDATLDLLKSRNGKPYGAASILEGLAVSTNIVDDTLNQFVRSELHSLLDSPSVEQLITIAIQKDQPIGTTILGSSSTSLHMARGTEHYLRNAPAHSFDDKEIARLTLGRIGNFEDEKRRAFAISLLVNPHLHNHNIRADVLSRLFDSLSSNDDRSHALSMLETLSTQSSLMRELSQSEIGPQLSSKLLLLADSPDHTIAERANSLSTTLSGASNQTSSSVSIIRQQLRGDGDALSVLTLADLGLRSVAAVEPMEILPDPEDWQRAIRSLCGSPMHSSLSITSPLHGVVWLIEADTQITQPVVRDGEDFSLLFRIVFFVTKVFVDATVLKTSSGPRVDALYRWYPVALELINEKLTLDDANTIWLGSTAEVLHAASDVLSEGTQLLTTWLEDEDYVQDWLLRGSELDNLDRETYFTALAYHRIISRLFDTRPQAVLQAYEDSLSTIHKSDDILESSSILSAVNEFLLGSQNGLKMVNELLSHITQSPSDFKQVALLNILLGGNSSILEKVPQQRQVFAFKGLVAHLDEAKDGSILCETFRLLAHLIPFVRSIYSDMWAQLLQELNGAWSSTDVVSIHAILQVYNQLKMATKQEDVSEDLVSAWSANRMELDSGLLHCLQSLSENSHDVDQPRSITAELLRRQLSDIKVTDEAKLYVLLNSSQSAVREAAYGLLHVTVPAKQEQLSIDLALEQRIAALPEELMNLITDVSNTQQYLLSWNIVFDHFPKASYRLRETYSASLKASGVVNQLLDLICETLRITSGRPLDASKMQIAQYDVGTAETPEQDIQWLSVHTYYLALLYTPALIKDWFLQQKNRVKQPLEAWTQKHMSPAIVASSMLTVIDWSSAQSSGSDDRPIEVKASPRGSEIIASIAVDPESPPISLSISLPLAYPLESPTVSSRTRVGVSEKNWQSWLRTIQIIIFSSGSIIEGLVAFRRNVQGALKGQTECAICYSIIGTDMQTPNKKCGTCKNMFHGACLFRWFKSSNSSSCPLCRNNFNYA